MTNLEHIKSCSELELALFLNNRVACYDGCPPYANLHCDLFDNKCHRCWEHWLKDEYIEDFYTSIREATD